MVVGCALVTRDVPFIRNTWIRRRHDHKRLECYYVNEAWPASAWWRRQSNSALWVAEHYVTALLLRRWLWRIC